jgi:hypothetical protein
MAIRVEHQPSAGMVGLAAYAAGQGKARQRVTERTMDVLRDKERARLAREQQQFAYGMEKYRQSAYNQRDENRFAQDQELLRQRMDMYSEADKRREIARRDAAIASGIQSGDLVLDPGAKEEIDRIRSEMAKNAPELDESQRADYIEKGNARIREISRYGAKPRERDADPNKDLWNWDNEKGWVKAEEGQIGNYERPGGVGQPVPTERYKLQREEEEKQNEATRKQAEKDAAAAETLRQKIAERARKRYEDKTDKVDYDGSYSMGQAYKEVMDEENALRAAQGQPPIGSAPALTPATPPAGSAPAATSATPSAGSAPAGTSVTPGAPTPAGGVTTPSTSPPIVDIDQEGRIASAVETPEMSPATLPPGQTSPSGAEQQYDYGQTSVAPSQFDYAAPQEAQPPSAGPIRSTNMPPSAAVTPPANDLPTEPNNITPVEPMPQEPTGVGFLPPEPTGVGFLNEADELAKQAKAQAQAEAKARRESVAKPMPRTSEIAALQQEQADKKEASRAKYDDVMRAAKKGGKSYAKYYDPGTGVNTKPNYGLAKEAIIANKDRHNSLRESKRQNHLDAMQARKLGMTITQYRNAREAQQAAIEAFKSGVAGAASPGAPRYAEPTITPGMPRDGLVMPIPNHVPGTEQAMPIPNYDPREDQDGDPMQLLSGLPKGSVMLKNGYVRLPNGTVIRRRR